MNLLQLLNSLVVNVPTVFYKAFFLWNVMVIIMFKALIKKPKNVKKLLILDMFQLFLNNIHEYCDAPRP
jgi:hypothetical protein